MIVNVKYNQRANVTLNSLIRLADVLHIRNARSQLSLTSQFVIVNVRQYKPVHVDLFGTDKVVNAR